MDSFVIRIDSETKQDMKTIIVPTDFSELSLNAARYAADMAHAVHASIRLVHVMPQPMATADVSGNVYEDLYVQAEESLADLQHYLQQYVGEPLTVDFTLLSGNVSEQLSGYCSGEHVFAAVMGTESKDAFKHFVLGSNTIAAMRHFSCPVFVIPPDFSYTGIHKIGLACDMKEVLSTVPLKQLTSLLDAFHPSLHVLTVTREGEDVKPAVLDASVSLKKLLELYQPSFHFIANDEVVDGLNMFVASNGLDLLLLVPKKLGGMDSLFRKSQTKEMVFHPIVPLVAMHES